MANKKVDVEIVKDVLSKIGKEKIEVDINNNKALLNYLFLVCQHIISTSGTEWKTAGKNGKTTNIQHDIKSAQATAREALDTADYTCQRGKKGNFILTSPPNEEKGWKSLFEPHDEQDTRSLTERTLDLVHECYGVRIPESDVTAIHKLKGNSVILRIWNRKNEAPYHHLVASIKKGGIKPSKNSPKDGGGKVSGEDEGVGARDEVSDKSEKCEDQLPATRAKVIPRQRFFINFQLTRNRYKILGHVKKLKKEGKIAKFDTTQNGDVNMTVKHGEKPVWLTFYPKNENSITYSIEDIDKYLPTHIGVKAEPKPKFVRKN
ncbi:MAG: hypothetical protein GY739_19725 [Mesoflavibacter sp.]|nr:hypothetical protein [Mesoflavibacter sp.]